MINYSTGSLLTDEELNLKDASRSFLDYVGDEKGDSFLNNVQNEDVVLLREMAEILTHESRTTVCFRMKNKSGVYNWVTAICNKLPDEDHYNIRISFEDLSLLGEDESSENLDFSTGLLTKKAIIDYARSKCNNPANRIDLCILDIDNFKHINDTKGHSFGDVVLREVSDIIKSVIGNAGKAGRIGGDEILIVIENADDKNKLRSYLKPIREHIEGLYKDKDGYPLVTVSIGTANYPLFVDNYDSLFNLADKMLYRAKSRGKNRYVMYNPEIHGAVIDGILVGENKIVHESAPQDKISLMLGTMDGLFGDRNKERPLSKVLLDVIAAYYIDEAYIFYNDLSKSYFGYKRVDSSNEVDGNKVMKNVETFSDIRYALSPNFEKHFNKDGVLVIDAPERELSDSEEAFQFYETNQIKHSFTYKMNLDDKVGYLVLYNTRDLSRKFAQQDVTDFTYLGKMIELALKTR